LAAPAINIMGPFKCINSTAIKIDKPIQSYWQHLP
jgi:hypothetical protein